MKRLFNSRVTARRFDEAAALVVATCLLAACTVLALLMVSELPPRTTFLLGAAVGAGWTVLAVIAWGRRQAARGPG
jgi:hypothetical protein